MRPELERRQHTLVITAEWEAERVRGEENDLTIGRPPADRSILRRILSPTPLLHWQLQTVKSGSALAPDLPLPPFSWDLSKVDI